MLWNGTYKKILDGIPSGVFVFDDKLRVKYTNAAFRRSFSEQAKGKGSLSDTLGCREGVCGQSSACAFCSFYKVMTAVIRTGEAQTETMRARVRLNNRTDTLSIKIRVFPLDNIYQCLKTLMMKTVARFLESLFQRRQRFLAV